LFFNVDAGFAGKVARSAVVFGCFVCACADSAGWGGPASLPDMCELLAVCALIGGTYEIVLLALFMGSLDADAVLDGVFGVHFGLSGNEDRGLNFIGSRIWLRHVSWKSVQLSPVVVCFDFLLQCEHFLSSSIDWVSVLLKVYNL
jgi:hypothetical protein